MKKSQLLIIALLSLTIFTGCKKEDGKETWSKEDQNFTWSTKQEKRFGNFDYLKISEAELNKLMKDKFKLQVPEFSKKADVVIEKALKSEDNELEPQVFNLIANGDKLTVFTEKYYKNKDGKRHSYGRIEWSYLFVKAKKEACLSTQIIDIYNDVEEGKVYIEQPEEVVDSIGEMMQISKLENKMATFNEQIKAPKGQLANAEVYVIDTVTQAEADKEIGRNLLMSFSTDGTPLQIHALIRDFSI